jgi:O-antigen/teichoic acid export membrane protein
MKASHKIAFNTMSQLVSRVIIITLTFIATIFLRRYLGRSGYGIYIYALNIITIVASLSDMGSYLTGIRESGKAGKSKPQALSIVYNLRGLLSLAGFLLTVVILLLIPNPLDWRLIILVSLLVPVVVYKETMVSVFHAFEKLYLSSLIQIFTSLISFVAFLWVVKNQLQIAHIFEIQLVAFLALLIAVSIYLVKNNYLTIKFSTQKLWSLFKKSAPLGGILILYTIYSRVDTLIIGSYLGKDALGIYGLVYKIYDNLILPAAFLANSLLPELIKKNQDSIQLLKQFSHKNLKFLIIGAILIILATFVLAPILMPILTGDSAKGEILVLKILSLALVFAYINHLTGYLVIVFGKQIKSLKIAFLALVINLTLNLLFIPKFGLITAAVTTIITELLVLVLTYVFVIKPSFKKI